MVINSEFHFHFSLFFSTWTSPLTSSEELEGGKRQIAGQKETRRLLMEYSQAVSISACSGTSWGFVSRDLSSSIKHLLASSSGVLEIVGTKPESHQEPHSPHPCGESGWIGRWEISELLFLILESAGLVEALELLVQFSTPRLLLCFLRMTQFSTLGLEDLDLLPSYCKLPTSVLTDTGFWSPHPKPLFDISLYGEWTSTHHVAFTKQTKSIDAYCRLLILASFPVLILWIWTSAIWAQDLLYILFLCSLDFRSPLTHNSVRP